MEKEVLEIFSRNHKETFKLGRRLADLLNEGDVVALHGELGSGKTVFVQGICAGLKVRDYVTSPSFTIIQEYEGRICVIHFDFYRLKSIHEIEDLDLDSYLETGCISLIEWAEKGEAFLPDEKFSVRLERIKEKGRIAEEYRQIRLYGPRGRGILGLKL